MTGVERLTSPPVLQTFAVVAGSAKGECAECPYTSTGMDAATRWARRFSAAEGRAVLRASRPSLPQRGRMNLSKRMTSVSCERAVSLRCEKTSAGRQAVYTGIGFESALRLAAIIAVCIAEKTR